MRKYFLLVVSVFAILFFMNCSKTEDETIFEEEEEEEIIVEETFNYTSAATYNLNVVYFIPKDKKDNLESHRRLSEILLQGQNFYKENMIDNGFGDKTFNMLVDKEKNKIKIDYVVGQYDASYYPYECGGNKMIPEIEAYYAVNPAKKNSEHYLVLTPVDDPKNSDVPYYGLGKWCFATDFNNMDIKHLGTGNTYSENATIYIGGLLHELGHGLNLPHNKEKVSDKSNSEKGTALMGAGNYTYGKSPTFITKASCAILNNNQIFNTTNNAYYSGVSGTIKELAATFENGIINISGTVEADVSVNNISIYNDPADDDADYDAVTWFAPITANNTFTISMPINELHKKENTEYVLRILLNHTNGDITRLSYAYKFENGIPIIDFGEKEYVSKTSWSIKSVSSEEASGQENTGLAAAILDNDASTYWHSCWSSSCASATYPHSITVDVGEGLTVDGFAFIQRNTLSRAIKEVEIFVSDDNITWTSVGNYILNNVNTAQNIRLTNKATFRYFKIEAKSSHDGDRFAALAEVYCF